MELDPFSKQFGVLMENNIKTVTKKKFKLEYNDKSKIRYPIKLTVDGYKYGFQTVEKAIVFCMEKVLNG